MSMLLYSQASELVWYWQYHNYIMLNSKPIVICKNEIHKILSVYEPSRFYTGWRCALSTTYARTATMTLSTTTQ